MAQSTVHILLPQTAYSSESLIRGPKKQAAAYYLGNADLQTVSWNVTNITATMVIQVSLVTNPIESTDSDWFPVHTVVFNNQTTLGYANIEGNFVWIRAKIQGWSQGIVNNIKVAY